VLFDCGDADFELEAFVDFVLFEFGELGVETIYFPARLDSTLSIFASSLSIRRSRRVSAAARSSLVAICLTTWASISPISLRVVFFGAICGKYSTMRRSFARWFRLRTGMITPRGRGVGESGI
jgi:hypothetical protein